MSESTLSDTPVVHRVAGTTVVALVAGVAVAWLAAELFVLNLSERGLVATWSLAWGTLAALFAAPLWLLVVTHGASRLARTWLAIVSVSVALVVGFATVSIVGAGWANDPIALVPALATAGLAVFTVWFARRA